MPKKSNLTTFLIMLVILAVMGVTIFFVAQQGKGGIFDLRNRASGPGNVATITLSPTSSTIHYVNDTFPVHLSFAANGKYISGLALREVFSYPTTPSNRIVDVVDEDSAQDGVQIKSLIATNLDPSFNAGVNQASPQPSGSMYIDYGANTGLTAGFTNTQQQEFATIIFKALKAGTVSLQHDPVKSIVNEKIQTASGSGTLDVLQTIADYTITVVADTIAPVASISGDFGTVPVTATSSSVTFSWSGHELPDRPAGTVVPDIQYSYQFDSGGYSAYSAATSITKVLENGSHTFRLKAKDAAGNVSTPSAPDTLRTFTLNLTPFISSISPQAGQIGTNVTINGYNFGATRGTSVVKFGTKSAASGDYVSWSDTQIVVKAPAGSVTSNVTVVVGSLTSNGVQFVLGTSLQVVFNLQGITHDAGPKKVLIAVKKGTGTPVEFANTDATWSTADNAYSATIGLDGTFTTASNYTVSVKESSRLRKAFPSFTITANGANKLTKTADANKLILADFNGDNKLNIDDIGLFLSKYTALSVTATGNLVLYDLNGDGIIDSVDLAALLQNYIQLELNGDSE